MSDWRKFLGKKERVVAPYFGGARVRLRDREVRLDPRPEREGFWAFEVEGRKATPLEAVSPEPELLARLPKARGVLADGALFAIGAPPERVALMPDDEPPMFASCTCHRWHDGTLFFGELELEGEAEEPARVAFGARRGLGDAKHVSSALRSAFAWATIGRASRERGIPCSPREAWPHTNEIADGGDAAASEVLEGLEDLRRGRRVVVGGEAIRVRAMIERAARTRAEATLENAEERAYDAIAAAGGRVTSVRHLARGERLEVCFEFGGERFVTLAEALSLQVIDAGICLVDHHDGHAGDEELTLESLPGAIREAMDLGVLVITRR